MKTKIKILYILTCLFLLTNIFISKAQEVIKIGDLTYTITNEIATITRADDVETIVIPKQIELEGHTYPVTAIAQEAFYRRTMLKNLTIPSSINFIGKNNFLLIEIENLYIEDLESWCNIEFEVDSFVSYGLFSSYANPISNNTSIFVDGNKIAVLEIPETVEKLHDFAFQNIKVKNIVFPPNITEIPLGCFEGCIVDELIIPETISIIGWQAFENATISKIYFPWSISRIENLAFEKCKNVKEIIFDCSPTIFERAFSKVTGFSLYMNYPLKDVYYSPKMMSPDKVYVTDLNVWLDSFFTSSFYEDGSYELYINDILLTELIIPEGNYADNSFGGIRNLESLLFDEGTQDIMKIGEFTDLELISLPSSLNNITQISSSPNLKIIELKASVPPNNNLERFFPLSWYKDLFENVTLYVPENSDEEYKNAEGWKRFKNIVGTNFAGLDNIVSTSNDDTLIYDLNGRIVEREDITPGIYIKEGRKFIVR